MSSQEDLFEIDEVENLIDNLEMVAHFLDASISYKWKWAIIALHQALYGALIITLQGLDPRQTIVDRQKDSGKAVMLHVHGISVNKIASSFDKDEETIRNWISNPYLISIDEALRRVKRKEYLPSFDYALPLVTTTEEDEAIRTLKKEFRNEFEHYSPKVWVVGISNMPAIFKNVLHVIQRLVLESNCVNLSISQELHINTLLALIEQLDTLNQTNSK